MPPRKHAALSPSGSERWMNCSGSLNMAEGLPDSRSPYATEGTAAHALAERCLRKDVDAGVYVGEMIEADGDLVEVTTEMAEAVQVFLDFVRSEARRAGTQLFVEHQLDFSALNAQLPGKAPHRFGEGTTDVALWQKATRYLHIIDYKHGRGIVVDPTENSQLMMYALGTVLALRMRPAVIKATIVQPRAGGQPVRTYAFTWDELVEFKRALVTAATATQPVEAPLTAGAWCHFCKAQATCPEQLRHAQLVAVDDFADSVAEYNAPLKDWSVEVVDGGNVNLLPVQPTPPEHLPTETLAYVLEQAPVLESWLAAVRAYVLGQLEAGVPVPGWKLVAKRATRRWTDENAAVEWMTETGFRDVYTKKVLSPAQVETEVKRLYPAGARPELPEGLVVKQSSGATLAPASDTRPALAAGAAEDFEAARPEEN